MKITKKQLKQIVKEVLANTLNEGPEEQYGSDYKGPGYYIMDYTAIYEGPYHTWDEAQEVADSEGMRVLELPKKDASSGFSAAQLAKAAAAKAKFGFEESKKG